MNKLMIVDDSLEDQELYKRLLLKIYGEDLDILSAESAADALELLGSNKIDLILLDYRLPDMDGVELLQELGEAVNMQPILMFTGQGNEKIAAEAIKLGANDYLIKQDLTAESLQHAIDQALANSNLQVKIAKKNEKIAYLAYHDALTGLPNRVKFETTIKESLLRCERYKRSAAVLFIDIDRFKSVNDSLGHLVGDNLLKLVGEKIRGVIRGSDSLCRLGGDEFGILLDEIADPKKAAIVASNIIEVISEPFEVDSHTIKISISIGIACYPSAGSDVATLIKNADIALYDAKESGRNTFKYFTEELNMAAKKQLELEQQIQGAMANQEFSLVYQPIISVESKNVAGFETLIRWHNKNLGDVGPDQFIPVAEELRIINKIGRWVFENAVADFVAFYKNNPDLILSVNLSPQQLHDNDWFDFIKSEVAKNNINHENIVFELTETDLIKDIGLIKEKITTLVGLGFKIYVDDFGTGYSSLQVVKDLPISGLKIDKSFVADIASDDGNMVKSIVAIASLNNLTVVAEGVETKEQLDFMLDNGIPKAQGYYFSKPIAISALQEFIKGGV